MRKVREIMKRALVGMLCLAMLLTGGWTVLAEEAQTPEDVAFAAGFYRLAGSFAQKEEEYRRRAAALSEGDPGGAVALMEEMCGWLREQIDLLFGEGTCRTAFGASSSLGLYQQFFEGVVPYIKGARAQKLERYTRDGDGVLR